MFRVPVGRTALVVCLAIVAGCAGGAAPTPQIVYVTPEPTSGSQLPATPIPALVDATASPTPAPTATPAPTPKPTPRVTPKPTPKLTYAKLSDRSWAKIVKSPDRYVGKGYLLWACIWQFDAATGPGSFLAQASNRKLAYWWTDGENAWFDGNPAKLADFVEDDVVYVKVVVEGSYSYDTQAGGNTTVPRFRVVSISRKGGC